ncbi:MULTISPECIES: hypothetical protein [Streptomyces]|uniref:Uncharacterized protein n=1 Tax=Streptomyces griseosporeus TaxID=1910 RepID=A0ABV3KJV7_STRGS|nr:hypothetical protein [Streptomyces actuosus]
MTFDAPPPSGPPTMGPPPPPPPLPPVPAPDGPKWARKRVAIPAAFVLLLVGAGIGSAGGGAEKTGAEAAAAPTVTVTRTAEAATPAAEAEPRTTVTVTTTATPKAAPKASPKASPKEDAAGGDTTAADTGGAGKVVFKVWGTAPSGALGPLDITYGSDSDNRQGKWNGHEFTATLPLDEEALYYSVTAQLQGSGDINCSVTIDGETEKGHASGGYNICTAQANAGLLGGWD